MRKRLRPEEYEDCKEKDAKTKKLRWSKQYEKKVPDYVKEHKAFLNRHVARGRAKVVMTTSQESITPDLSTQVLQHCKKEEK